MTRPSGTCSQVTKNTANNDPKKSLHSKAMTRANQLKKEGNSLSEALKQAWAELKADRPTTIKVTVERPREVSSMNLSDKVKEYKELESYINILKERMDEIKSSITSFMEAEDMKELDVDIFKIRYQEIVSRKLDTKAFKKEFENIYEQFLYESKCKRFTIAC